MMVKYWKEVDILDIELKEGEYEYSEEIAEGVILDIDKSGEILSIEILDMPKRLATSAVEKMSQQYLQQYMAKEAKVAATKP